MTSTFTRPSRRIPNVGAHIGGAALLFIAAGILLSTAVEAGAGGEEVPSMALSAAIVALVGFAMWRSTTIPPKVRAQSTFVAVGSTWILASVAGAVPFVLAGTFPNLDSALFESVSGFTGTGSTVLAPIEDAPRGILFWRNMTQWYGGTGMVVLTVAILPFLGVGGMELLRAEAPGPTADRLVPRVSETAKRLWMVYGGFTVVAFLALLAVGLSPFDAGTHAFTVVSTGGLSPYDASIAAFDSALVEATFIVLMLYGGINFALHWRMITGDRSAYRRSPMLRFYLQMLVGFVSVITALLWLQQDVDLVRAFRDAAFNVTTLLTSTGFGTVDYTQWVPGAQLLLFALMISGGMAGSTSGGLKLIRARIFLRHATRELRRIRYPRAVLPVKLGRDAVPEQIVQRVLGFGMFYALFIIVGTVILAFLGAGLTEAAGAATSVMGNMGPALGEAGPASNYLYFSRPARGLLMFMMLAGRLEILPVLFVLSRLLNVIHPVRSARNVSWLPARTTATDR